MSDHSNSRTSRISVFAPVSIGNVSVGFDNLGLAVAPIDGQLLGDIVHIEASHDNENHLTCKGSYKTSLPANKEENIIWQCIVEFNKFCENPANKTKLIRPTSVHLTLEKNIPICSGTGSSACSVVAGLNALNQFYDNPFSERQLLKLMGKLEAKISGSLHYDNVAPCYLGGLQLMLEDQDKICQSIPVFEDCFWVISYPNIEVSTRMAREILPDSYSRQDIIQSGRLLASFIDASYRQDKQQAFSVLKDIIAEPYRKDLLPNFAQTKSELINSGCLAVGISGSGPTVFAVCNDLEQAERAKQIFDSNYLPKNSTLRDKAFTKICKVDLQGSRRIHFSQEKQV